MQVHTTVNLNSNGCTGTLQNLLQQHGARFPFPHQLAARFPHIVQKIVSLWRTPDKAKTYFKNLMLMDRDGCQGFPPAVYTEIRALKELYEGLHAGTRKNGNVRAGFST